MVYFGAINTIDRIYNYAIILISGSIILFYIEEVRS